MEKTECTNKMGTERVSKVMIKMAIPMILSMVLQAFYNIVDSAFVSNMDKGGEEALNALTLAFPVQMLIVAIGIGTGVGANALVSKCLGEKNHKNASRTAGNAVFLAVIIYIVFLLFGIFGVNTYISSQSKNAVIVEMACTYLRICCVVSFGMIFFSIFEKLLQAAGKSIFSTIAQVLGAVTNIVLDPIMIYGWIGCPEFGVSGAAYATVIGQCVSFLTALIFHLKFNKEISNKLKYFVPSLKIIKQIYMIGLPAIVAQALMSVMTYALNIILVSVNEAMVTAYGLYYKVQQFILFAAFGVRDAITPIIAFNFGMQSKKRINEGIKFGLIYTIVIMLIGTAAIEIFANLFSSLFGLSGITEGYLISTMRIISLSFVFAGINIALQGVFQAVMGGLESLIVSVLRQLVLVVPPAYILALVAKGNEDLSFVIWFTFLFAEVVTAVVAYFLMKRIYKKRIALL